MSADGEQPWARHKSGCKLNSQRLMQISADTGWGTIPHHNQRKPRKTREHMSILATSKQRFLAGHGKWRMANTLTVAARKGFLLAMHEAPITRDL